MKLKTILFLICLCFSEGVSAVDVDRALHANSIYLLTSVTVSSEFHLSVCLASPTAVFLEIVLGSGVVERK